MKLEKILTDLGTLEKGSFTKVLELLIQKTPAKRKSIDAILSSTNNVKGADSKEIVAIYKILQPEFQAFILEEFCKTSSQLDIVIDILLKDGMSIIKQDWFAKLYRNAIEKIRADVKRFYTEIESDKSEIEPNRKRDYKIYQKCLTIAFNNDRLNNQEGKITGDEQSILNGLAKQLELSQDEVKLINYGILEPKSLDVNVIIEQLKSIGAIFYSKKSGTIYVADEVIKALRKVRHRETADKFSRRVLTLLREPQINLVARKHNIDRKLTAEQKIEEIISQGVSISNILTDEIHKEGLSVTEKKKFLNEFCDKSLGIHPSIKGTTLDEKMTNLLAYFDQIENDEKVHISVDGYIKLLQDLKSELPNLNKIVRDKYQFQEEEVLEADFLLDRNLKPIDILDIIPEQDLATFIGKMGFKTRGEKKSIILESYKDSTNIFLENYLNIGYRRYNELKDAGVSIREAEIGLKFEEITKIILGQLGFEVDEKLRQKISTSKDKVDILIKLSETDVILVECKTVKDSSFTKYSSVSRQLKSYVNELEKNGLRCEKCLLIAPEFSDEFINGCQFEHDIKLSLLTASALLNILNAFKKSSKYSVFPHNLIRDVLVNDDIIAKALKK